MGLYGQGRKPGAVGTGDIPMSQDKAPPRYIQDGRGGGKVLNRTTSVNITAAQSEFLKVNNINLSGLVREAIETMRRKLGD